MWLDSYRQSFSQRLLRFLWRQWSQIGVAGRIHSRDHWIIDPEALIVFTMKLGRYDPRLFDEAIDWTVRNGRWISLQRLKNIALTANDETKQALAAFADVVDSYDKKHRWRALAQISYRAELHRVPFFLQLNEKPLPIMGELDEHFQSHRLDRPKVLFRNLSVPVPMSPATNLLFKLRSLFGLAPRAEVIAYLLTHNSAKASAIAKSAVYSHPPISDALAELIRSALVYTQERGVYSTDIERWQRFLEIPSPIPAWVEWPRLFKAILILLAFLTEAVDIESDYLVNSRSVTTNEALRDMLADVGFPNPFLKPMGLDDAVETLIARVEELMSALNIEG